MAYDPPTGDTVNFEFESYSPPSGDGVDFDFAQLVVLTPDPIELEFGVQDAFVAPIKTLVEPDPVELQFDAQTPFISANRVIRPDPIELEFGVQTPFIAPFLYIDEWQVDREQVRPAEVSASPQTTTLRVEVSRSDLDFWRQYDRVGDYQVIQGLGGSFRAVDRSGGDPVELRTSFNRMRPFVPSEQYLVNSYSEEQLSADRYAITLTLQRQRNRDRGFPELHQTSGDWVFDLDYGSIALDTTQVGQISRQGEIAGASLTLPLLVSDDQAAALLDNLGYPAGIVDRPVPDGQNFRADSTNGRQTITIAAPSGATVGGGYFVTGWTLSFYSYSQNKQWRVELELAEAD